MDTESASHLVNFFPNISLLCSTQARKASTRAKELEVRCRELEAQLGDAQAEVQVLKGLVQSLKAQKRGARGAGSARGVNVEESYGEAPWRGGDPAESISPGLPGSGRGGRASGRYRDSGSGEGGMFPDVSAIHVMSQVDIECKYLLYGPEVA